MATLEEQEIIENLFKRVKQIVTKKENSLGELKEAVTDLFLKAAEFDESNCFWAAFEESENWVVSSSFLKAIQDHIVEDKSHELAKQYVITKMLNTKFYA